MIELDELPRYGLSVRDFGARGDGASDDSAPIQQALDRRGLVVIPFGVYCIGRTLRIGSHTRLRVHPGARLFLADGAGVDSDSYLVTNARHAEGDADILIEGGIWDGNNPSNPRGPDVAGSYTGVLANFRNVQGLSLRAMVLRDPESYFVRLTQVSSFLVEHIEFQAPRLRPNQDGIHIAGFCQDGVVRHVAGHGPGVPNDDILAFSADDALGRAQNLGKLNGPISRIQAEHLSADDCHTFVRLLSVVSPVEDISVEHVRGGCQMCAVNADGCRECRVQVFDPDDPAFADGVGRMARISLRDFEVHKSRAGHPKALLDLRTQGVAFTLERFRRDAQRDAGLASQEGEPAAPTLRLAEFVPCRATLEGLGPEQLRALLGASLLTRSTVARMRGPAPEPDLRLTCDVPRQGALVLPEGGFEALSVNLADPES